MSLPATSEDPDSDPFLHLTPAGCYYAIEGRDPTVARQLLTTLLGKTTTPALHSYAGTALNEVLELHKCGFISLQSAPAALPQTTMSESLPQLLPALSQQGRVVLTESRQGLYIDYAGVEQDEAEELAVLAADLHTMAERGKHLLVDRLNISSQALGIVDPAGNSEIGFWPLHIAQNVFTLIVLGIPRFNTDEFRTLVWMLSERYGATSDA